MEVTINYWAVLASAIVAIALGSAWYGPLFGKQWMKLAGIEKPAEMTKSVKKMMMKSYAIMAVGSVIMAGVLAHSLFFASAYLRISGVDAGIQGALWMWIGFVAPVTIGSVIWEGKSWKYWFITAGYYLVSLVLMGVILAVWQ